MMFKTAVRSALALTLFMATANVASALNSAIPGVQGDVSRSLLGDGTGVIIGIVDSGIDDFHPALAGLDSLGNPRMVAEASYVPGESSTGDDVHGHGTRVASAALSRDPIYTGMAPDARYVNARVLSNTNGFASDVQVKNGIGFAITQGADVLNLSLNFNSNLSNGLQQMDLMLDWAAYSQGISCAICVGNIPAGGSQLVRSPGSAFNGITVGRTTADYSRVHTGSAEAFTSDSRMKPDVVAPGTGLTLANDDWESQADWLANQNGCSYATPFVAGMMAQQIDAGRRLGLSTDPLVIKATLMNSASKVLDKQGNAWAPYQTSLVNDVFSTTRPLDNHSGAGQINGAALATQYLAGEMGPGFVDAVGWDINTIGIGQSIDYLINPNLAYGSILTVTLAWNRHVSRTDNGDGIINAGDLFSALPLSNLDLEVFKNGMLVAQSISAYDNVEHLFFDLDQSAQYMLRVKNISAYRAEKFALAWFGTAVPEPSTFLALTVACITMLSVFRRR